MRSLLWAEINCRLDRPRADNRPAPPSQTEPFPPWRCSRLPSILN